MLGLIFLLIGSIYLALSVWVVMSAMREAQKRGIEKWKWGVPAGLVMYLLVFWDHIPTVVAHQYYCHKEAGFTVYKTIEEWKRENPGVAEALTYKEISDSEKRGDDYIYHLNQRFDWHIKEESLFLSLKRRTNKIIDIASQEVLAQFVDFKTGGLFHVGKSLIDYKFWWANETCDRKRETRKQFYKFEDMVQKLGRI